jgi:hypothetical protein
MGVFGKNQQAYAGMTTQLTKTDLSQFTGTETYYPHWTGRLLYTDGIKYLADQGGAHWLIDAIASYQGDRRITGNPMLRNMQFWKLTVVDARGTLTCVEDSGRVPLISQEIEFTDFPLDVVEVWVERGSVPTRGGWLEALVALLPSER